MLNSKDLAALIREAMDDPKTGISSAALAETCHVTPQAVHGWRKTGRVHKSKLKAIATATHKPLHYFLGTDDPESTPTAQQTPAAYGAPKDDPRIPLIAAHFSFLTEPQRKEIMLKIKSMADANRVLLKQLTVHGRLNPPSDEYVDKVLNHDHPRRRRKYGKNV